MPPPYMSFFPKPSLYPNQGEAMDKIYKALQAGKPVLFEGACGTGKTLSALAPALAVAKEQKKKVIIATSVHQQMEQFVEEAREIAAIAGIKVAVLKGKAHMCPLEKDYEECAALKENTFELVETERDVFDLKAKLKEFEKKARSRDESLAAARISIMSEVSAGNDRVSQLKKRSCSYMKGVLTGEIDYFNDWLFKGVRTPEEVSVEAVKKGQCPYELVKRSLKEAELLICNYHHLLDSQIQGLLLVWMDCEMDDVIVIFDEAHNLEAQARSHSSMTLSENTVEWALNEASSVKGADGEIQRFLLLLQKTIRTAYESRLGFGDSERLSSSWTDITIRDPYGSDDLLAQKLLMKMDEKGMKLKRILENMSSLGLEMDKKFQQEYKEGKGDKRRTSSLLAVASFLEPYFRLSRDVDHYPVLNIRRTKDGEVYGRIELFSCIPTDVTKPLLNGAFGIVLMSATLRPFDMVKATLGVERDCVEIYFGTPFPPERRRTLAASIPPQFAKSRGEPGMMSDMTTLLEDIIESSDGNVLIVFPSSAEANKYASKLKTKVKVIVDTPGTSAQDAKTEFFRLGDGGGKAALITYLWGTLTEGVDYKFDRCRTVAIIGVGFPSLNDRMKAIEAAYDNRFGTGKGWEYGVLFPTIRRIRQANGRVVRSPLDYGVRVLIDNRYTKASLKSMGKYSVHNQFPEDEREEFLDVKPDKVKYAMKNFFKEIDTLR